MNLKPNNYSIFYFLFSRFCLFVLFSIFYFLASGSVSAAELFFEQEKNFGLKDQFKIGVFVETEEAVNAIEGKINFPNGLLELKSVDDGNSIINLWLERPATDRAGEIIFSGIIPGGYKGDKGLIFSATFLVKKEGNGTFDILNARALRNDGMGAETKLQTFSSKFIVSKKSTELQMPVSEIEDIDLPESFMPEIAKDKTLFDGKWFVVFATQDKASGIDHYEIKESRQKVFSIFQNWSQAESPYVLKDQKLKSWTYVKAVDKAGNERIIKIAPRNQLAWYESYESWTIIILGVFIAALAARKLWIKKRT